MNTKKITQPVLVLVGPTASGKTALSIEIAKKFDCEIISMDSMQVYRYMNIGTAKATKEERAEVPHHLIDIVNPDEQYDAARFAKDALIIIDNIHKNNKIPFLVGGTGMYLSRLLNGIFEDVEVHPSIREKLKQRLQEEGREALYQELFAVDEEAGKRLHINDTQRLLRALEIYYASGISWSEHLRRQKAESQHPDFSRLCILGIENEREILYNRIRQRSKEMMGEAFVREVKGLLNMGYSPILPAMQSIGYRHMLSYLHGFSSLSEATENLVRDTQHYAKRQMTWFRHQHAVRWINTKKHNSIFSTIQENIQKT